LFLVQSTFLWKNSGTYIMFLDPYDGDSEDASSHSDCSLNSLNDVNCSRAVAYRTPEVMALEGSKPSEDNVSLHTSSNWGGPIKEIHSDVYMETEDDCKTVEALGKQKDFPVRLVGSTEQFRTTGPIASTLLVPDPLLLTRPEPSTYAGLVKSPVTVTLQTILVASDRVHSACEQAIKRKQELPILEGGSEKLRKKLLVT
uniref:Uncharacterized protein n=1 Tax=Crocodylus porosus TaxID=8502 RepID=A0A7M4F2E2_CROPO